MKTKSACILVLAAASAVWAQVPGIITYQGRVTSNGTNFTGAGLFRFVLYQPGLPEVNLWSHDNSSVAGAMPVSELSVPVTDGLFTVALGDTNVPGMTLPIPADAFTNSDTRLRIWFNDGASGVAQLAPDQRITSSGYALMSANVPEASITPSKLAPGFWNVTNLPPNSVTSEQLADSIALGATNAYGRLDVYGTLAHTPAISLLGSNSQISTFGTDGLEQIRLWGGGYGELLLNNSLVGNETAVRLAAQGSAGGVLQLRNASGINRAVLEGQDAGGILTLLEANSNTGAVLYGDGGQGSGALSLRDANGSARLRAFGGPSGGSLELYETGGHTGAILYGDDGQGSGALSLRNTNGSAGLRAYGGPASGSLELYHNDGTNTVKLVAAQTSTTGGRLEIRQANGRLTAVVDGEGNTGGGFLELYKGDGTRTVWMDADDAGEGRISTQVLEITGGSDFSENFEIQSAAAQPGMIMKIDAGHPGQLTVADRAYDRSVAGVVSGAGGVRPGLTMGQNGTLARGRHPVALTGRVYCLVDADRGAILPGDLITTSDTPGHGMRVTDHARAQGAIVGKAMTGLASGRGLVLVLVSLQ